MTWLYYDSRCCISTLWLYADDALTFPTPSNPFHQPRSFGRWGPGSSSAEHLNFSRQTPRNRCRNCRNNAFALADQVFGCDCPVPCSTHGTDGHPSYDVDGSTKASRQSACSISRHPTSPTPHRAALCKHRQTARPSAVMLVSLDALGDRHSFLPWNTPLPFAAAWTLVQLFRHRVPSKDVDSDNRHSP